MTFYDLIPSVLSGVFLYRQITYIFTDLQQGIPGAGVCGSAAAATRLLQESVLTAWPRLANIELQRYQKDKKDSAEILI